MGGMKNSVPGPTATDTAGIKSGVAGPNQPSGLPKVTPKRFGGK